MKNSTRLEFKVISIHVAPLEADFYVARDEWRALGLVQRLNLTGLNSSDTVSLIGIIQIISSLIWLQAADNKLFYYNEPFIRALRELSVSQRESASASSNHAHAARAI
jgi:hypothetical protein